MADRNQQISAHDAVDVRLVEDAFGSREPAGCRSHRATLQEAERQPGCRSSGAFVVASIEKCLVRAASEGLALRILPDEVGSRREPFEVFGFEGPRGRPPPADSTTPPGLPLEGFPRTHEFSLVCHVESLRMIDPSSRAVKYEPLITVRDRCAGSATSPASAFSDGLTASALLRP